MQPPARRRAGPRTPTRPSTHPLTPIIGAEITGVNLARAENGVVAAIQAALLDHKVLFFRGQDISQDDQVVFAQRLGELTGGHPTLPSPEGQQFILELDSHLGGRADHWHTDVTFALEPPAISILRAVELPPVGGDTQWASTQAAYDRLPGPLQRLAAELHAVHTNDYDYGQALASDSDDRDRRHREAFTATIYETEHPVVRVHPETGQPALLLGGFARQIVGLPPDVSRDLLRVFAGYVTRSRAHRQMEVECRGRGHLGQPRHPALCRQRLRRCPPGDAAGDGVGRSPCWVGWLALPSPPR